MKKIFLSVFAVAAFSLLSQAQFRVGVKAGGNISQQRINVSSGNSFYSNDRFKSYHGGLISEFKVMENVYVQPQVLYTRKGSTLLSSTGADNIRIRVNSIDVPVMVVYKLPVSFGKIVAGAGPSFAYGFSGKQEQAGQKQSVFSDKNTWKREELSLNLTAGVEFHNGLFVSVQTQKGLMDIYKAGDISVKNRSVSASIGYMIDWKQLRKRS